jgi:hypothetical protein
MQSNDCKADPTSGAQQEHSDGNLSVKSTASGHAGNGSRVSSNVPADAMQQQQRQEWQQHSQEGPQRPMADAGSMPRPAFADPTGASTVHSSNVLDIDKVSVAPNNKGRTSANSSSNTSTSYQQIAAEEAKQQQKQQQQSTNELAIDHVDLASATPPATPPLTSLGGRPTGELPTAPCHSAIGR